jgi:ribosomal protein S12 methylthiotransferase accessory factor
MTDWYASLYTGLFRQFGPVPTRAHDPAVSFASGTLALDRRLGQELIASGAGWDAAGAEAACVGEAVERWQAYPLPDDQRVEARFDRWPLDEPAVEPEHWVLFHPEQYAQPGFPFEPLTRATRCRWVCMRRAADGTPCWVPEEMAYLFLRPGEGHRYCPGLSTGLACGRSGQPVLLRGLQEVIERDAVVGAWWGSYPIEEWPLAEVLQALDRGLAGRQLRPNLRYRCYRVRSPFSAHVTLVTLEGPDREGYCFSAGSACRETRRESWNKSLLEAVHSRQYARYLKVLYRDRHPGPAPAGFPEHAVYYSLHPQELQRTVLHAAPARQFGGEDAVTREDLGTFTERLGSERPVVFRDMTPPALAQQGLDWRVVRVVVPGLQPLHGDHHLPHLGGPLWAPRGLAEWAEVPPHPFP